MSEIIESLLNECSNVNCHKYKIEKILNDNNKSLENLDEDIEKRTKQIIQYAKGQVRIWKFNEFNITKTKLLKKGENKINQLYRKLAQEVLKIEDTMKEVENCKGYNEVLILRDKIRGKE